VYAWGLERYRGKRAVVMTYFNGLACYFSEEFERKEINGELFACGCSCP
jgi:hypothetical protein